MVKSAVHAPEGPGLRAGLGGPVLSSGSSDLDQLCGGGLSLGSLIVVFEDEWRAHSSTLMSYFMAEGVACQHQLAYHTREAQRTPLQQRLPALVVKGSKAASTAENTLAPAPETELKIAWQYRRYIKSKTAATTAVPTRPSAFKPAAPTNEVQRSARLSAFAHNFDLSKPCQDTVWQPAEAVISCCSTDGPPDTDEDVLTICKNVTTMAEGLVARVQHASGACSTGSDLEQSKAPKPPVPSGSGHIQTAAEAVPTFSPTSVGRIALESVGSIQWPDFGTEVAEKSILKLLLSLKAALQGSRCVAMVSMPIDMYSESFAKKVLHISDIGIRSRSVRDDSELVKLSMDPHSCCGLLEMCKFSVPGCISLPVSEPMLLMLRHRRTRLAIVPIEIDPDAEMEFADSTATLTSNAAAMLCQPGRPDSSPDF